MYRNIVFIICSFLFSGELEVDGGLTVTEGVTASSFIGNGSGLSGIGIKPERIYFLGSYNSDVIGNYTVPEGKLWVVYVVTEYFQLLDSNLQHILAIYSSFNQPIILTPNYVVMIENNNTILNIFEYPISGSGTDQGMNYVEP